MSGVAWGAWAIVVALQFVLGLLLVHGFAGVFEALEGLAAMIEDRTEESPGVEAPSKKEEAEWE